MFHARVNFLGEILGHQIRKLKNLRITVVVLLKEKCSRQVRDIQFVGFAPPDIEPIQRTTLIHLLQPRRFLGSVQIVYVCVSQPEVPDMFPSL